MKNTVIVNSQTVLALYLQECRNCGGLFETADRRVRHCSGACARESKAAHQRRRQTKHRGVHPDRVRCRQILKNAVIAGAVRRVERCEECGERVMTDAHHEDYARPFYVRWLCESCHSSLDGGRHFGAGQRKPASSPLSVQDAPQDFARLVQLPEQGPDAIVGRRQGDEVGLVCGDDRLPRLVRGAGAVQGVTVRGVHVRQCATAAQK